MKCCDGGREHTRACIDRWVQTQLDRNPGPVSAEVSRRVIEVLTEARAKGAA